MTRFRFQMAKKILSLSKRLEGTFANVGGRPMSQAEARRIVESATRRMGLVDSTG